MTRKMVDDANCGQLTLLVQHESIFIIISSYEMTRTCKIDLIYNYNLSIRIKRICIKTGLMVYLEIVKMI